MNAADLARSPEMAQAIASAAALFRLHFPDARANLTPWRDDPLTREFREEESVDLAFHFPGWSPRLQCRSLLIQLRLSEAPAQAGSGGKPRLLGVLISGMTFQGEQWRLATVGDWQPSGPHPPQPEVAQTLQQICRQLFDLLARGPAAESGR
ncbi:hypothetical protein KQ302_02655 [Synechococcus sp. CS-602]|uniref:hypothetical protein n=1 Tax=unclassified Synechococcus TaxID=2626047 RepID=UPI0008FF3957|nr:MULTISPECIES: hypothetical protein [unclassified Synechococcus]MCT4364866.1 hypothetical protein [Candidatus Regnicoccus frigidus MAG-AL1]APD48142.1 hypothetical protein BM449_07655 [Synechococcus sp. SynAce01]MCT0203370.1 hypothetical protein [Synechococcus sp. CS-603]MCT0204018.1 hypothetical protein [Synechococcus sp. CS-602]MCT0246590.1 hypothetical protein [Synechococcus sp. CS-601]